MGNLKGNSPSLEILGRLLQNKPTPARVARSWPGRLSFAIGDRQAIETIVIEPSLFTGTIDPI